jgi:hypothetical protein
MNTQRKAYRKAKALKNDDFIEYSEEEAEYLGLDLKQESDDFDEDRLDDDEIVSKDEDDEEVEIKIDYDRKPKNKKKTDKEKFYVDPKNFDTKILEYYESGVLSNELAEMVSKIAHKLSYAPNFINYCVDEETEFLTDDGWKTYQDTINDKTKILSYNKETKKLVWSKIIDIFRGDYNGLMFKLNNIGLDALVTPNHKFVSLENGIKPIEEFRTNEHMVLMGTCVEDPNKITYTNDFVELVGWSVTEGNFLYGKNKHSVQIFQKEGEKAQQIRELLDRMQLVYKEYDWSNPNIKCFRLKHDISNDIISVAKDKILNMDFINSLTQEQRVLLIKTMVLGDGWNRKNNKNKTRWSYSQKCKNHIDNFVALCTLAGFTTSTTLIKNIFGFTKFPYYIVNIFQDSKLYCNVEKINMHRGRAKSGGNRMNGNVKNNTPTVPYDGKIWCPQTEYGTFVCRRGKYVYVTGNSYREEMVGDGVIRMFKALMSKKYNHTKGTNPFSYFTRIAFNAFRNRIKKEKHIHETHEKYKNEFLMFSEGYNNLVKNNKTNSINRE